MTTDTAAYARLDRFYGRLSPSLEAILASLSAAGIDPERPRARDLFVRDLDCHNLGMHEMVERIAAVATEYGEIDPDGPVLDLGCGLGGPGRFLADRFGCAVLGVDLLPARIDVAQALTSLTGMQGLVSHRVADATALPSEDGSFAHVWMLDVGIHIRDKRALFGEIARALRPGGLLVMHDMTGPLPRAMLPARRQAPYIAPSLPQLLRHLEGAGLRVLTWRDTSRDVLEYFLGVRRMLAELAGPAGEGTPPPGHDVLEGYVETLAHLDGRTGIVVAHRLARLSPGPDDAR